MDDQKPKPKIASLRTYAQDLTTARERRTSTKNTAVSDVAEKTNPVINNSVKKVTDDALPPKVFSRSNKTTPVVTKTSSPQNTLDALVKNELKSTTPKPIVPSALDHGVGNITTLSEDAAAATIITDTKKDRFKLLPSIFTSINNWFSEKKRARERSKAPRYTVAETSRRKGVIQKATSSTGKAASADFASIQERIRRRKLAEVTEKNKPTTTWSANTESGFLLLEAPEAEETVIPTTVQNVVIVPKKSAQTLERTPRNLSRTTVVNTFEVPAGPSGFEDPEYIAKTEAPKVEAVSKVVVPEPIIQPVTLETKVETPAVEEAIPEAATEETVSEVGAPEVKDVSTTAIQNNSNLFLRFDTNAIALLVSVVTIFVLAFGTYLYQTLTPVTPLEIFTKEEKVFPESALVKLNLGVFATDDLVTKLAKVRQEVTKITEVAINLNATELDPSDSISLINKDLSPDFTHSLTLARPGFSSEQVPFLAFKVTDRIIALGTLLAWERSLYDDFMIVFGTDLTKQTSSRFIDASLAGTDVRVLKNTAGEEIMIYGIINNTIIITTNSLTFAALATVINN